MIKIVRRNVIDDEPTLAEWLIEFAPYIACGFAAGFALGIVINLWCLSTALPSASVKGDTSYKIDSAARLTPARHDTGASRGGRA